MNGIVNEIKAAYQSHVVSMTEIAKKALEVVRFNIENVPELNDKDYQVKQLLNYLEELKDVQGLDEVQGKVLRKHTDGDICHLEIYDDTCDLRSQYQSDLETAIDEIIIEANNL